MTDRPPGYRDRAIPRERFDSWPWKKPGIERKLILLGVFIFLCQVLYAVVWK